MYRRFVGLGVALMLVLPSLAGADVSSDIHITPDGLFSAKNLTVLQKASTTFFVRGTWGTTYFRMSILTNASTTFSKNHGEAMTVDEVAEGQLIDVEGRLVVSTEKMLVDATKVRDVTLENESKTLAGTITSVDVGNFAFTMSNPTFGKTTVKISVATMKKGERTIQLNDLAVGDKVVAASGTYDFPTNVLTASSVSIFQAKEVFTKKNFQGTLKSVAASVLPTTLVVTIGGSDYTVHLDEKVSVLKNNKAKTGLNRFAVGDIVRIYGAVGDQSPKDIAAEVVRDLNF